MLLTSKQVAEKLGVSRNYVTSLAREGKLQAVRGTHPTPSGRSNYGYDDKVVAEFRKTFVPPAPRVPKQKAVINGNGHAPLDVPLPFNVAPTGLIWQRLDAIEAKLDTLLAAWGVK